MRALALALVLVAAALPVAGADSESQRAVGMNLGYVQPGTWCVYYYTTAGPSTLSLTWQQGMFPFADYDLRLYRPNALQDGALEQHELIAESSQHPYAHHSEHLAVDLAPGTYTVAVAPFQAQGETFTLVASPGDLQLATCSMIGYQYGA
jgi:hypothetical protein